MSNLLVSSTNMAAMTYDVKTTYYRENGAAGFNFVGAPEREQ